MTHSFTCHFLPCPHFINEGENFEYMCVIQFNVDYEKLDFPSQKYWKNKNFYFLEIENLKQVCHVLIVIVESVSTKKILMK